MVLTVRQIIVAVDSGALKRLVTQPIPAVGAWRLRRVLQRLEAEYGPANAARMSLMNDQNSLVVNNGAARMVRQECAAEFEANPVFAQQVTLDVEPIPVTMLDGATISAADMDLIAPLLCD